MLHVVLPRQHPDGGERGGKSGAGHPVTAQVVSRSGARTVGFEIDENHFANLMKADIKDAVYTASACANFQGAVPRGGRAGRGHKRDGGERAFGARWRDGGEHHV